MYFIFEIKIPDAPTDHTTEADKWGGQRIQTFMIYLSDVEAGGHTIFPQAGISIKPKEGSALFWFNRGPKIIWIPEYFIWAVQFCMAINGLLISGSKF